MVQLFDYFKFARQLNLQDGRIELMQVPVHIIPVSILCSLQKEFVSAVGVKEAYKRIYESSKKGSWDYNQGFIKKLAFRDKRKTLDWQLKIVTFAGWGKLEVTMIKPEEKALTVRYNDSPFPKEYGKSTYPVDFLPTGFTAGGVAANFGADVDAIETKCMAMGDPYCEIEIGPPEKIENKKQELWSKLKL